MSFLSQFLPIILALSAFSLQPPLSLSSGALADFTMPVAATKLQTGKKWGLGCQLYQWFRDSQAGWGAQSATATAPCKSKLTLLQLFHPAAQPFLRATSITLLHLPQGGLETEHNSPPWRGMHALETSTVQCPQIGNVDQHMGVCVCWAVENARSEALA